VSRGKSSPVKTIQLLRTVAFPAGPTTSQSSTCRCPWSSQSPSVGLAPRRCLEEGPAQQLCVVLCDSQGRREYFGLVPPARVPRIEAIIPKLCYVYDRTFGMWQFHGKLRPSSAPWIRPAAGSQRTSGLLRSPCLPGGRLGRLAGTPPNIPSRVYVFIHVGPVNSLAVADDLPARPLPGSCLHTIFSRCYVDMHRLIAIETVKGEPIGSCEPFIDGIVWF